MGQSALCRLALLLCPVEICQTGEYNSEWPIWVNTDHILGDEENFSRLPAEVRDARNLPLLLEMAEELAWRKAVVEPGIVVPQGYQDWVQYLLPICRLIWRSLTLL